MYAETRARLEWKELYPERPGWRLALFGMGNVTSLEQNENGITVRIESRSLPLIIIGTAVGFYRYSSGKRARADWSLAGDGDLTISISQK